MYNGHVKKNTISELFIYKYRFVIGYAILWMVFVLLLFMLPSFAQHGLSEAEMESAVASHDLLSTSSQSGDLVDLPYHLLQKISIALLGLSPYTIKLPSIIIGLFLGLLLILLLNRWFKNNVSLLASILVVLSTPFLYLAGSGTPLIMLVFWPTLLLWLGSKIQGEKSPRPLYSFLFAIAMLFSIFTPYMIYFAIFCVLFVLRQPHLRFVVRTLPRTSLILVSLLIVGGLATLTMNIIERPDVLTELLFAKNFEPHDFFNNILSALRPVFMWTGSLDDVFLTPLMSLPTLGLAMVGLLSTTKGFFASRNSIATMLLIFNIIISGFNPRAILFFMLPLAILVAHGLKYLLEKWYGLFPENPYARIAALVPLTVLFVAMLIPNLLQYIDGYRYNPSVAGEFNYNLPIITNALNNETLLVDEHYDFYKILEDSTEIKVIDTLDKSYRHLAVLHSRTMPENYQLDRIFTSPLRDNSDIIYIYTDKGE